jgi:hypothetical protein
MLDSERIGSRVCDFSCFTEPLLCADLAEADRFWGRSLQHTLLCSVRPFSQPNMLAKSTSQTAASMSAPDASSGFSLFNVQANRKIYNEFVTQHERDRHYIEQLQSLLREHGIDFPEVATPRRKPELVGRQESNGLLADASLAALEKVLSRVKDHGFHFEIKVQYRNLTFWNTVPEARIPTVGSTIRSILTCGAGPKRRVNILNDLTGRILPGQMTLLMGPPGCGERSA